MLFLVLIKLYNRSALCLDVHERNIEFIDKIEMPPIFYNKTVTIFTCYLSLNMLHTFN